MLSQKRLAITCILALSCVLALTISFFNVKPTKQPTLAQT